MSRVLQRLNRTIPTPAGERTANADESHPMRRATRAIASSPDGWTPELRAQVTGLFDQLAPGWNTRAGEQRLDAVHDALERGPVPDGGTWLELGSGTGLMTSVLARRADVVLSVDLSEQMLSLAPRDVAPRLRADGATLPVPTGSIDVLVAINAFLFPTEAARVVAPDGTLLWVNTSGAHTPIHLPAEDVLAAMGSGWHAVASEAGWGTWAVLRRARD
jgi:SAM-dependent methyltransferase